MGPFFIQNKKYQQNQIDLKVLVFSDLNLKFHPNTIFAFVILRVIKSIDPKILFSLNKETKKF